ncbi:MAG: ERAP1-like C-terminal domain-containing protein [Deltaproteobacteria bacterium]|nr:ERAP1-like C-terminal domain-containing protein [Deltaproteobacteria bacterium]
MPQQRASLISIVQLGALLSSCAPRDAPQPVPPTPRPTIVVDAAIRTGPPVAPGLRLPAGAEPLAYDVRLEVDPDKESFQGTVEIRTRLDAATTVIWLHAVDLEIASARIRSGTVSDVAIPTARTPEQMIGLQVGRAIGPGEIIIAVSFTGHTSRDQEGLFRQRVGGTWFLFSQGQAVLARRILPCFDEPRFKVPWRVTLVVPPDLVALGNAPVASEQLLPDRRREVTFAEIGPLPSYLFAIAVGPFTLVDGGVVGRNNTPVRIAVWPSDASRVTTAIKVLPKLVTALEDYLDRPLPWPKLDLVAVPQLFGAMENVGLVTFESSILIGDESDPGFVPRFTRIAGHELAHQWMGNVVTPVWWDELWLSEAFATFLAEKVNLRFGGHDDPVLRAQLARSDALSADAISVKRALRRPIESADDADDMFDEITYEKGGAVLEMFEHAAGPGVFREVVRELVRSNASGWVTTDKLVAGLGALATPGLARSLAAYAGHAGTPIVDLTLACDDGTPSLIARARDGLTIPVCVRYPGAGDQRACALVSKLTEIALPAATSCPAWIVGNEDGRGYYQTAGPASLLLPPATMIRPAERLAIGDDLAGGVRRGEVTIAAAAKILKALIASKESYAALGALAIAGAIDPIVDARQRPKWTAWLASQLRPRLRAAALLAPRKAVDREVRDAVLELVSEHVDRGAVQRARAIIDAELTGKAAPTDDLGGAITIAAPRDGRALFDRIVKVAVATKYPDLAAALLASLGSFGPALAAKLVETALDRRLPSPPLVAALVAALRRPATQTAAWQAIRDQLPQLMARLSGIEARPLVEGLGELCTAQMRLEVAAAVEPRVREVFRGRETLGTALASIERCVTRQASAGEIAAALPAANQ